MKQRGAWKTDAPLWDKLKPLARQNRHESTEAESLLWERLRGRRAGGFRFRRQHSIGRYIVDFYCAEKDLVVEVDGPIHEHNQEEDASRQAFLESLGLRVIRFTNDEVMGDIEAVARRIVAAL